MKSVEKNITYSVSDTITILKKSEMHDGFACKGDVVSASRGVRRMNKRNKELLRIGAIGAALLLMGAIPALAGAIPQGGSGGGMAQVLKHAPSSPAAGTLQNLNQGIIPPIDVSATGTTIVNPAGLQPQSGGGM